MRTRTTSLALAAIAAAGLFLSACSATTGAGGEQPPGISASQQCQLLQASARGLETTVLLMRIKDNTTRIAVNATLDGVKAGAADYCDAVITGESTDALRTFIVSFNASLDSLNAQLRAAQAAQLATASPGISQGSVLSRVLATESVSSVSFSEPGGARFIVRDAQGRPAAPPAG